MKLPRRQFLYLTAGAAALPIISRIARAQTYPSRAITMVVPAAAGGPTDTLARIIIEPIRASLRQTIIIENMGTAAGSVAVAALPTRRQTDTRSVSGTGPRTS